MHYSELCTIFAALITLKNRKDMAKKQGTTKGHLQFYAVNDQRSTAIKQGYSLRVIRLPKIDSGELAEHVERDSKIDRDRVAYLAGAVAKQIRQLLLNGHKVELGRLGTIGLTCNSRGSDNKKDVTVKNNVKGLKVTFRPSGELKSTMKGVSKELVSNYSRPGFDYDEHGALLITDKKE